MNKWFFPILLVFAAAGFSSKPKVSNPYFDLVRKEITGQTAYEATAYIEPFWRVAGNTGFDASIRYLADQLEKAGYKPEEKAQPGNPLRYRIEKRKMEVPTWEPVDASLTLAGEKTPLLQFASNRNMIAMYSASTPDAGVTGEVVHIQSPDHFRKTDVKGKIVFAEMNPGQIFQAAHERGALGILTYDMPAYLQPEKNTTSIQFRQLRYRKNREAWGIALSYAAKEKLKATLAKKRALKATVKIKTRIYPSEELTLVADIQGRENPDQRLVFSAHVQEPGANDNASGAGAQLEMALAAARLVKTGQVALNRSLTFLWGDEIVSTRRYIQEDPIRAGGIKWGISLDMVGENTAVTGGSFLIEKMPDPSAIWTRGEDRHTEWGGEVMRLEQMKPHYLNDFILRTFREQGAFAGWTVNANPFEGGSDHTPFIDADIPGLLLWHFTDQFYHTDNDRMDKVSQETLRNVATGALAAALVLVNADEKTALDMVAATKQAATNRLNTEFELSKKAIREGADPDEEAGILAAWREWYVSAIASVADLETGHPKLQTSDSGLMAAIAAANEEVIGLAERLMRGLRGG